MYNDNVLTMILAGGEGKRIYPLTKDRAKPAVPFGGRYRIIDFVLNNFTNSGFYKIKVLTQFKSDSLNKHISRGWPLSPFLGQYIDLVPAQMRTGDAWYKGTADAVFQNINMIYDEKPTEVCVFGSDHIYKMDIRQPLYSHRKMGADLTVSAIPVPIEEADQFGIMEVNDNWELTAFKEKPKDKPKSIPGNPNMVLASMGNYIFNADVLTNSLEEDARDTNSCNDFGKNIIPNLMKNGKKIFVYDFSKNHTPGMNTEKGGYWRDVGNIEAYYQANMDLLSPTPEFDLYDKNWPLRTCNDSYPPAKFIWNEGDRIGMATNSLVAEGCIISGARLNNCIVSTFVKINSYAQVEDSIIMNKVNIGRHCKIRKAIIDKGVDIPANTEIGINKQDDIKRGFHVSKTGITVVPKGTVL